MATNLSLLKLQDLVNPRLELRYSGVDTGLVLLCAANAPTYHSVKHETPIGLLNHHWSTTVTLQLNNFLRSEAKYL